MQNDYVKQIEGEYAGREVIVDIGGNVRYWSSKAKRNRLTQRVHVLAPTITHEDICKWHIARNEGLFSFCRHTLSQCTCLYNLQEPGTLIEHRDARGRILWAEFPRTQQPINYIATHSAYYLDANDYEVIRECDKLSMVIHIFPLDKDSGVLPDDSKHPIEARWKRNKPSRWQLRRADPPTIEFTNECTGLASFTHLDIGQEIQTQGTVGNGELRAVVQRACDETMTTFYVLCGRHDFRLCPPKPQTIIYKQQLGPIEHKALQHLWVAHANNSTNPYTTTMTALTKKFRSEDSELSHVLDNRGQVLLTRAKKQFDAEKSLVLWLDRKEKLWNFLKFENLISVIPNAISTVYSAIWKVLKPCIKYAVSAALLYMTYNVYRRAIMQGTPVTMKNALRVSLSAISAGGSVASTLRGGPSS
jgi:hypothetical protein